MRLVDFANQEGEEVPVAVLDERVDSLFGLLRVEVHGHEGPPAGADLANCDGVLDGQEVAAEQGGELGRRVASVC